MRHIKRNLRAISPVLAVLMMIAIAIAGTLVTYAWIMGYTGFNTEKAGKAIQIQSLAINPNNENHLLVYVKNIGQGTTEFDPTSCVYINNMHATVTPSGINTNPLPQGETATIETDTSTLDISASKIKVKVVTTDGTYSETKSRLYLSNIPTAYTITVFAGSDGTISPAGPLVLVNAGDDQAFTINANMGYHILDVQVDGESRGTVTSHTFEDINEDHAISAFFAEDPPPTPYVITASAGAGGTIDPSGMVTVDPGDDQAFTINANMGYHIVDVQVDGESIGTVTSYTFTNVIADHTISATFAPDTGQIATSIVWGTFPSRIEQGTNYYIIGFLFRTDRWFGGLNQKTINLIFTPPNGPQITETVTTRFGIFWYSFSPDAVGTWSVYAQFNGDSTYQPTTSSTQTFTVTS